MMRLVAFISIYLICLIVYSQDIKDLKWLEGTWNREGLKEGQTATETWEMNGDNAMIGWGITKRGEDTVFVEKLEIVKKYDDLFYVADVAHNAAPVYFKIVKLSKGTFICENPAHDFPKKIEYMLNGNKLVATISGDGKEVPFYFTKKDNIPGNSKNKQNKK